MPRTILALLENKVLFQKLKVLLCIARIGQTRLLLSEKYDIF